MARVKKPIASAPTFGCAILAHANVRSIPAGATVQVRISQTIDSDHAVVEQIDSRMVAENMIDQTGGIVIPRGSRADIRVSNVSGQQICLDLPLIAIGRTHYRIVSKQADFHERNRCIGANKSTSMFIGGGAAAAIVIGAIAGGGKGAAIGAIAGGPGGAGGQLNKSKPIRVPAESLIPFQLVHRFSVESHSAKE